MAKFSMLHFLIDQFTTLPLVTLDLIGKTVIVVGTTVGLGLEAARHFAAMKPGRLILANRTEKTALTALAGMFVKVSSNYA